MTQPASHSIAALLSFAVRVIFWIAILVGIIGFVLVGTGVLGSLNGGVVKLPGMATYVENVQPGRLLVAMVGIIVFAAGIAFVCSQLRHILRTLAEGDPFVPENGPRLTRIAVAIALIELIRNAAVFGLAQVVDLGDGFTPRLSLNLAAWGAVLTLIVLAEVFKEGSRLREDQQMTI